MNVQEIKNKIAEMQKHLEFDCDNHQYWYDGKPIISVTQLLKKHNLSKSYDGVDPDILQKAIDRGNAIHEEIARYVNDGIPPMSDEAVKYAQTLTELHYEPVKAEFMVGNDVCAGTVDTLLLFVSWFVVDDHKTGSSVDLKSVTWQNSLYAYFLGLYPDCISRCSHLPKTKKYNYLSLELIPLEEVEKLLECERNGIIYEEPEKHLSVEQSRVLALQKVVEEHQLAIKKANAEMDALKEKILTTMRDNGVLTADFGSVKFTRKLAYTQDRLDTKGFKEKCPKMYARYVKQVQYGESLVITIK